MKTGLINKKRVPIKSKAFLWMIIFCLTKCFGFIGRIPILCDLYSTDAEYILLCNVSVSFLVFIFAKHKSINFSNPFFLTNAFFFCLIIVEILFSFFKYRLYGQNLILTLKESFYFLTAWLVGITFLQFQIGSQTYILKAIKQAAVICGVVACIQFICYEGFAFNLLNLDLSADNSFRNGTIRFSIGGLILPLSTIVSLTSILKKKTQKLDYLVIIFSLIQYSFFLKTRGVLIEYAVLIPIMILSITIISRIAKISCLSILLVIGLFVIIYFDSIFENVQTYVQSDASILIRFDAIEYYMNQFKQSPLLGFGFISSDQTIPAHFILGGVENKYYRVDVGIFGFINEFGILGMLWLFFFYYISFKSLNQVKIKNVLCSSCVYFLLFVIISSGAFSSETIVYAFFIQMMISSIDNPNICKPKRKCMYSQKRLLLLND